MSDLPKHTIKEGIGHEGRGATIVHMGDLDCRCEQNDLPLAETIAYLQSILEDIPAQFRKSAVLRIEAFGDYASISNSITFDRPETDAELADRRRWLSDIDQEREAEDRQRFERLRAKYGG